MGILKLPIHQLLDIAHTLENLLLHVSSLDLLDHPFDVLRLSLQIEHVFPVMVLLALEALKLPD